MHHFESAGRRLVLTACVALLVAACGADSTAPGDVPLTLWIAPPGTYHLQELGSAPISLEDLEQRLRSTIASDRPPASLEVRALEGTTGYDFIMARQAACNAGLARIEAYARVGPDGSAPHEFEWEERLPYDCAGSPHEMPDSAAALTPS